MLCEKCQSKLTKVRRCHEYLNYCVECQEHSSVIPNPQREVLQVPQGFTVGEKLFYPAVGVVVFQGSKKDNFYGEEMEFSIYKRKDGFKIMLPKGKEEKIGIRKLTSPDDIKNAIEIAPLDLSPTKKGVQKNMAEMGLVDMFFSGVFKGYISLVKSLKTKHKRNKKKLNKRGLCVIDRATYNFAKKLIVEELREIKTKDKDVQDAIDGLLDQLELETEGSC